MGNIMHERTYQPKALQSMRPTERGWWRQLLGRGKYPQEWNRPLCLYAYKGVNIFHKHIYRITILLSTHCKTYCLAFQKRRFCTVKAAVLHRKTYAFATSNRNYRFSSELFLQNKGGFLVKPPYIRCGYADRV